MIHNLFLRYQHFDNIIALQKVKAAFPELPGTALVQM